MIAAKRAWKTPSVVTRELCLFDGCGGLAEMARGRTINGYCAGHRKQKLQKRALRDIRRVTLKERLVEFGSQISDETLSGDDFEKVLHNFYVFVMRRRIRRDQDADQERNWKPAKRR